MTMEVFLQLLLFVLTRTAVDRRSTTTVLRPLSLPFVQQQAFHVHSTVRTDNDRLTLTASAKDDDTTAPSDKHKRRPPPYNKDDMAIDVFSNVFFYEYEVYLEVSKPKREAALKDMTVGGVYRKYVVEYPSGKLQGMVDFAELISARNSAIKAFLDPTDEPVEKTLYKMNLIDLCGTGEIEYYYKANLQALPTVVNIWNVHSEEVQYNDNPRRSLPLCIVLGPSGSGKTCFTLQYLRKQALIPPGMESVTLYVHPADTGIIFQEDGPLVAEQLINWIRKETQSILGKEVPAKLNMHVCLVFDEAGSSHCKQWFENEGMLRSLNNKASYLASSVTLVVAGTGITGQNLSSSMDAFMFRMKPWQASDLSRLLGEKTQDLCLAEHETIDTVASAIFSNPKLGALATNGRCACFLVRAVTKLSAAYWRVTWGLQLNEWTQALVTEVVYEYIASNGIKKLNTNQRRRVAASVFLAVHEMKAGATTIPTFSELEGSEIPVAESLIQYNVERGVATLQVLPGEDFAFTITPALVLVLYSMAGVYTTLTTGWKSEEELAALYSVRQSMVQCMQRFVSDLNTGLTRFAGQKELDESLQKIRLIRLGKKLESKDDDVIIPMVDGAMIMMNFEKASFADVIARETIIQAKHTEKPFDLCRVNLYDEVGKCGLLKDKACDTRLLQGLIAVWQDKIDINSVRPNATTESSQSNKAQRNPQCSKAFPENVLSLASFKDTIRYAVIQGKEATTMTLDDGETEVPLPVLDGTKITFILSTNAQRLSLDLGTSNVTVTEAEIDNNMEIIAQKLGKSGPEWTNFVKEQIREGVRIKFLFTC